MVREPLANGYLSGKYRPGAWVTASDDWRSGHDPAEIQRKLELVEQIGRSEVPESEAKASATELGRGALARGRRAPSIPAARDWGGRSSPPAELAAVRLVDAGGVARSADLPAPGRPSASARSSDDVAHLVGVKGPHRLAA